MVEEDGFKVRICIRFAGLVVLIVLLERRQFFGPFEQVLFYAVFFVVHKNRRRNMHSGDKDNTFFDAGFLDDLLNLGGYVNDFFLIFGVEPEIVGIGFHGLNSKGV